MAQTIKPKENRLEVAHILEKHSGDYQNDQTGRCAYNPKVLLKVVLLAYSRGLISSRQIERVCCENVIFMAMSCDQRPDHSTIASFVSSMKDQIKPLFRDILLVCEQEGLLGGTFFAIDGCKLSGNASKEWSGKIKDLKRKKEKIEGKLKALVEDHIEIDKKQQVTEAQMSVRREKQIRKLEQQADKIEKWLSENKKKTGANRKELQRNVTDNNSAKMHTSHGTVQGYNGQALVDSKHQVIVHGEAIGKGPDNDNLPPVIDGAKENLERIWVSHGALRGYPVELTYRANKLLAGIDPVSLDYYTSKYILFPLGGSHVHRHNPDADGELKYHLTAAMNFINDNGGINGSPTRMGDENIEVYHTKDSTNGNNIQTVTPWLPLLLE